MLPLALQPRKLSGGCAPRRRKLSGSCAALSFEAQSLCLEAL